MGTSSVMNKFWEKCRSLSRTRPVQRESSSPLQRCLGSADLVFVGIGTMLGSGVYILTGEIVGDLAGPAAILSFLMAGLLALLAGLSYFECAVQMPETGASYLYAYVSLGEIMAFLVGWNSIATRVLAVAYAAQGWSAYFDDAIGGYIQNTTIEFVLGGQKWDLPPFASYPDFVAGAVIIMACIVISTGTGLYTKANSIFVVFNIVTVALIFVVAMIHADFSLLTRHGYFPLGFAGVMNGAVAAFLGYAGFETIAFCAEEAKDPSRGLIIGLISSFGASFFVYVAATLAITVLTDYQDINIKSPFITAFEILGLDWMKYIVAVGALCSMNGGLLNNAFCLSRSIYPMSKDGLLPAALARTHERTNAPVLATISGTCIAVACAIFLDFVGLVHVLSCLYLFELLTVCVAVVILRYKPPVKSGYISLDSADGNTGQTLPMEMTTDLIQHSQNVNESNVPQSRQRSADDKWTINSSVSKLVAALLHSIETHPTRSVILSLCFHLLFEIIWVALLTHNMDGLLRAEGAILFGIVVSGALSFIACFPLFVLPQYTEGLNFKVPLMPFVPLLSLLCEVILLVRFDALVYAQVVIWMTLGLLVYFTYGMRHSKEGARREDSASNDT